MEARPTGAAPGRSTTSRIADVQSPSSGCATSEPAAVEAALAGVLRDASPRHAIVLGHHPLASGGPHGARFGWQEHVFPFLELDPRAWIPLPVIGSIWPLLRIYGQSDQDIPAAVHRAFADALGRAFQRGEQPLGGIGIDLLDVRDLAVAKKRDSYSLIA